MNRISLFISMVLVLTAFSGCTETSTEESDIAGSDTRKTNITSDSETAISDMITDNLLTIRYADYLVTKANELAESEFAKISAVELIYKNVPEFTSIEPPSLGRKIEGWAKSYRKFTSYEIVDIYRSDSYIYPVTIEINFHYDQYNTLFRVLEPKNGPKDYLTKQELSRSDFKFQKREKKYLDRRYRCDSDGNHIGKLPDFPPRPYYFYKPKSAPPEPNSGRPQPSPPVKL